jgi:hypothetical protein
MSLFNVIADSRGLSTITYKLVSPANSFIENFNPQKTETKTITRKINKPFHPPLIMNNTIINQVTEHKHLDLEISNDDS